MKNRALLIASMSEEEFVRVPSSVFCEHEGNPITDMGEQENNEPTREETGNSELSTTDTPKAIKSNTALRIIYDITKQAFGKKVALAVVALCVIGGVSFIVYGGVKGYGG